MLAQGLLVLNVLLITECGQRKVNPNEIVRADAKSQTLGDWLGLRTD